MEKLNVGDKVKVNFEGQIEEIRTSGHLGIRHVVRSNNGAAHMLFSLANEDFTVTEKAVTRDENWPPQAGDVWKTKSGDTYFARRSSSGNIRFYFTEVGEGDWTQSFMIENQPGIRLAFRNFS